MKKYFFLAFLGLFLSSCSGNNTQSNAQNPQQPARPDITEVYNNSPLVEISPGVFPSVGNPNSKINITYFFDPFCPPCRYFEMQLQQLLNDPKYKDSVVVNKHIYSLGNQHFPKDQEACLLHLEMVKRHLYGEFRDQILSTQANSFEDMMKIAETLAKTKIPMSALNKNKSLFKDEVNLANSKKLDHTPFVFVNGREITFTPAVNDLKKIVDYLNKK